MDRGKIIKGLEICVSRVPGEYGCAKCPYEICGNNCEIQLTKDAIAMLKEHGHGETFIVIDSKTGKEADTYNIALHEDWAKHLCYCDIDGWAIQDDGTLLLIDDCGQVAYADRERFKVKWE
jgi:hypothetical protein